MKFTDYYIKNLKTQEKDYVVREGNGFAIYVYASGVKTWYFIYTYAGKKFTMTLGQYPDVSLIDARREYNKNYDILKKDGKNPKAIAETIEQQEQLRLTVGKFAIEYMEKYAKKFKKSWATDERVLNKEIIPLWGKRHMDSITRRDAVVLLEKIVSRGAPEMSNKTLKVVRKMFNFAVERAVLDVSPLNKIKPMGEQKKRSRVLSVEEIPLVWHNLDTARITDRTCKALKLTLVTMQRPGEVCGMHSDEIDGCWWTIPRERVKNGKPHRVYLTPLALEIIGDRKGYIFAAGNGKKPVREGSLSCAINANCPVDEEHAKTVKNLLGVATFQPHDLRRTANTHMARLRIPREYRERILNHATGFLDETYDLYEYDDEKQEALTRWSNELERIIKGQGTGKVIPLYPGKVAA